MEYYKKIDKSFFEKGFTVPKKYLKSFILNNVKLGHSSAVTLI